MRLTVGLWMRDGGNIEDIFTELYDIYEVNGHSLNKLCSEMSLGGDEFRELIVRGKMTLAGLEVFREVIK